VNIINRIAQREVCGVMPKLYYLVIDKKS